MKIFEISWEVCNKVGGINTVLKSKARCVVNKYNENYFMIGPLIENKIKGNFVQTTVPLFLKNVFEKLKEQEIFCSFGKWLIDGKPNVILIDTSKFNRRNAEFKKRYWDLYKIDSLNSDFYDYDVPIMFSTAAGILINEIEKSIDEKIIVHCHEWLSGGAALYLKMINSRVPIVFTTHATMLGRTISGHGIDLYDIIDQIDDEKEAYKYGVHTKHQTEKALAKISDVFTTVSEITAFESEKLLKRKPDVVLPNGIDTSRESIEELLIKHSEIREKMRFFLMYHFYPHYYFDLEQSLNFYIACRYEFRTKGIDIFIDALADLNDQLIAEKSEKTIIAFFFIPAGAEVIKENIIENKEIVKDLVDKISSEKETIFNRIIRYSLGEQEISKRNLFSSNLINEINKTLLSIKKDGLPEICTHKLNNENQDPIINRLKQKNLINSPESKVKVIFYPTYLTGSDGLLNLDYNEVIIGSHLGVFPSRYEPWGYTPVEAAMNGVPAITSDFSGFGRFILSSHLENKGIFVLKQANRTYEERVKQLSNLMYHIAHLKRHDRIDLKFKAREIAKTVSWDKLIENYFKAYELALNKDKKD